MAIIAEIPIFEKQYARKVLQNWKNEGIAGLFLESTPIAWTR
jgi:hypothetical protein